MQNEVGPQRGVIELIQDDEWRVSYEVDRELQAAASSIALRKSRICLQALVNQIRELRVYLFDFLYPGHGEALERTPTPHAEATPCPRSSDTEPSHP